jgi:hypothetical protein
VYAPSSELVPPTPSSESERVSPLGSKGGEQHSLAGDGVGGPNSYDWIEAVALSGLGGRLKEKSPSRGRPEFGELFLFLGYEKKAAKLRWVGGGA